MLRFPVRRRTQPFNSQITLVEYDPEWPVQYEREAERIRRVLGRRALQVEHIGSISVPGLITKPIIDILLAVTDSSDEPSLPSSSRSCRLQTDNPGVPTVTSIAPSMVPISTSTFTSLQQDQRRSIGFSCYEIGCKRILAIQSLHKEPEGQLHSLQLRGQGRATSIKNYNASLSSPILASENATYNWQDSAKTVTVPNGKTTTYVYDYLGRLVKTTNSRWQLQDRFVQRCCIGRIGL